MPKVKSNYQGVDGAFYIVNPAGAIHSCTRDHAAMRLRLAGWRLAEDPEIEVYLETKIQRHDHPIAEPWNPEPEVLPDVPDAHISPAIEATEEAAELAEAHGIDLATITVGSGARGRILVKDIQAAIDDRS